MTIYPWVLTALTSLRYGGVSLTRDDGRADVFDHDLDFLIQMPNATQKQTRKLVEEWQHYLKKTTGLHSFERTPSSLKFHKRNKHNNIAVSHFFIWVRKPSRTTE